MKQLIHHYFSHLQLGNKAAFALVSAGGDPDSDQHEKPLHLRLTLDGLQIVKGKSACNSTFKWLEFEGNLLTYFFMITE